MLTGKMRFFRPTGPGCTQGMNWIEAGASLEYTVLDTIGNGS
jgi:hypothetical protein